MLSKIKIRPVTLAVIVLITAACIFIVVAAFRIWQEAEDAAFKSCVLSVQDSIARTLDLGEFKESITLDQNWKELSGRDKALVFEHLSKRGKPDCGRFPYLARGESPAGEKLTVRARKAESRIIVIIDDSIDTQP